MRYRNDISAEDIRAALDYDKLSGAFTWRNRDGVPPKINGRYAGKIAGCLDQKTGAIFIGIGGKIYLAHRLAWLHVYGEWPENHIDHINGDRADNRIDNLRNATHSQNLFNRGPAKNNSCGVKGVFRSGQKFIARITANGKSKHIGTFATAKDASDAYAIAALEMHGPFARTA